MAPRARPIAALAALAAFAVALAASPASAATPSFVGVVASRSVVDSGSQLALTVPAGGVAAGDTVIVVGAKGKDQEAVASVTDSRGNVYRVDRQLHGAVNSGMSMTVLSGYVASALLPGDTITIQYEGAAAYSNRFGAAYDFSGLAPTPFDSATDTGGYGSTVTTGSTPSTQDGDLVFGLYEFQAAAAAFTPESGLNPLAQVAGGAVGEILQPVWKVAGAAGPQSASGTTSAFVSWYGIAVTYKSGSSGPPTAPANTALPVISGTSREGSTLATTTGAWSGTAPLAYAYQWQRCPTGGGACANVGTNAATYTLVTADVGATIQVVVTASNSAGSAAATSAATAPIAALPSGTMPVFVQTVASRSVTDDASNTLALTVPAAGVAAGDTLIVVGAKGNDQAAIASVADSRGNVYRVDRQLHGAVSSGMSMTVASGYIAAALQSGDTVTITYEGTASYSNRFGAAYEFSGLQSNAADVGAGTGGYGSQVATGQTAATSQDSELVFGLFESQPATAAFTAGTGFTALPQVTGSVAGLTLQPVYRVATVVGAQEATGTFGSLVSWYAMVVAYRGGSGGAPPPVAPANTALPTIGGTPSDGATLTASPGTWSGTAPISYTYQWQRCPAGGGACTNVGTGPTYVLGAADVGSTVKVVVTAANAGGSATATSAAVTVTAAPPANTAAPAVSGSAAVGSTLTASTGTWSGTAPITYAFAWQRCDSTGAACAATGVTASTYALADADAGSTLRVTVTATNAAGSVSASSAATGVVSGTAPPPPAPRFVKDLGARSVTDGNNNQLVFTVPAGGVAAGDTILLAASKGSGTDAVASAADTRGNLYTVDVNLRGGAGTGMGFGIASGYVTTALAAGDQITVTFEGTTGYTNRWGIAYEFAGLSSAAADVSATGGGYGTSPAVGPTATTNLGSELVFGLFDVQSAAPTFTVGSGFQALTPTSTTVLGQSLQPEFRVVSSTGTQRLTGTLSAALSYFGAVVTYRGAAGPTNTVAPTISGNAAQGATLTASTGTWTGPGTFTYTYQWQRCDAAGSVCANIAGATAASYVVVSGDVGGTLRAVVTANNGSGSTSAPSARTAVVTGTMSASPPTTVGLQLWYEANSETAADGAALSTWHDKSGNGRDLTAGAGQAPVFHKTGLNGRATVEFDGVTSLMKTYGSTFTIGQPSTFFVVYRSLDANTAVRAFVFDSRLSTQRQAFGRPGQNQIRLYADADLDFGGITYPFAGFEAWAGTVNGATSSLWRNGQLVGSGNAGMSVQNGFAVGGLSTTGTGGYDMSHFQVAEILYYAGALSAADRQAVTNWLNLKYALF